MKAVILVPWRASDPQRKLVWEYARAHWSSFQIVTAAGRPGPFNKAAAVNAAARRAGDWDVAAIVDADTVVPVVQLQRCIGAVARDQRAARPFRQLHRLTERETAAVLARASLTNLRPSRPGVYAPGGIVVVPRRLWDLIGGMDERFVGWGGEDNALVAALTAFGGRLMQTAGVAYHLWHQQLPMRREGPQYAANRALALRYNAGIRSQDAIRALIDERVAA